MGRRASRFIAQDCGEFLEACSNGFGSILIAGQVGRAAPYLLHTRQPYICIVRGEQDRPVDDCTRA